MATISSREIIRGLLENEGLHSTRPGPRAYSIWEYRHRVTRKVLWAVYWTPGIGPAGPFVGACELLWTCFGGHINPLGILADKQTETHES